MKLKKLSAWALCLCLVLSLVPCSVFAESTDGIFTLLGELNIMQGDPDGNLRLNDAVTRAEFTKVAVAASSYKNSVATNLAISPFPDVTYKHWAASYVRVGVVNGLVSGYPDTTFRPDDTVLFEEGVTIMLRVLGYTDIDFGASWPYGQISLANNLELTENVDCVAGDIMNRRQVAQLVYNALGTKCKGQNAQLASVFDVTISDDVTLISDALDDPSIASDEVYTSNGSYKIAKRFDRSLLGLSGEVAVKNGSKLLAFVPDTGNADYEQYLLYAVLPGAVMVYKDGVLTSLSVPDSTPVYKGKSQSSFANLKASFELGDILRVKHSSSGIDSIICTTGDVRGPLTVSTSGISGNWETNTATKVMRNGLASSIQALEPYDIAYFMPDMNLILAYSDKVTGVYEKATPNKDFPQSISLSGKEYTIESGSAFTALASGGTFDFGDTITILLGKTGQIAGVISPNATSSKNLTGYVLETGQKEFQSGIVDTYNSYYIKIAFPDGTTGEYATDKNLSSYKNKVVSVAFKNGYAKVTLVTGEVNLSGTYDHATGKLGKQFLSADAQILDVGTVDSGSSSVYAKLYPQRLDGVSISSSQILYYEKNAAGKIDKLILKDVTGDGFSYGLMTTASQNSASFSGSYSYLVNGQSYQLNTNKKMFNIAAGSGIKLTGSPSNPSSMSKLTELSGGFTLENASELIYRNTSYPISPNVAVYQKSAGSYSEYIKIPITDILESDDLHLSAYYDQSPTNGGQIRIIVVY